MACEPPQEEEEKGMVSSADCLYISHCQPNVLLLHDSLPVVAKIWSLPFGTLSFKVVTG
jgi:hypothetical protein